MLEHFNEFWLFLCFETGTGGWCEPVIQGSSRDWRYFDLKPSTKFNDCTTRKLNTLRQGNWKKWHWLEISKRQSTQIAKGTFFSRCGISRRLFLFDGENSDFHFRLLLRYTVYFNWIEFKTFARDNTVPRAVPRYRTVQYIYVACFKYSRQERRGEPPILTTLALTIFLWYKL